MPEGRTPGRHDGRDAEVRRFSPLSLRRHPSSRARRRHTLIRTFFDLSLAQPIRSSLSRVLHHAPFLTRTSRISTLLFFSWRTIREKSPHPHSRQGIPNDSLAPNLVFQLGSSFCHQMLNVCVNMSCGSEFSFRRYSPVCLGQP